MTALEQRARRLDPRLQRALLGLLAALVYYWAIELSDWWTPVGHRYPLLWLPSGIAYAVVLSRGAGVAPVFSLAALAEGLVEGRSAGTVLVAAAGAGLAPLVALTARSGRAHLRDDAGATLVRTLAAVGTAAVGASALVAAAALEPGPIVDAGGAWTHGFLARLAGVMLAGPFIGSLLRGRRPTRASRWETLAMLAATCGLAEAVSSGAVSRAGATTYLLFPPVLWGALRCGRRGVSAALLLLALIATANVADGHGPFQGAGVDSGVALDAFLVVLALTALLLVGVEHARGASESRLARREGRFRALIENATDLVTVLSPDGTILYESPAVEAIVGWTPAELEGTEVFAHIHPDDLDRCRRALAEMAAGGREEPVELRYRHKDGRWVDLVSLGRNLLDDPTVGGIVVNSRDDTQRRRTERELVEAERRYRTLVERLPLVTYVNGTTPHEPPRYVSPQIEEMLGYPVDDWYADPRFSYKVIHEDDLPLLDELFVTDDVDSRRAEYRMIAADGRVVWVLDHMVTIRDAAGDPLAVQGFPVDVTERKQLEDQLRSAQRMESLGLLAGGVAHDFNNLLTAIAGYGELARTHLDQPQRARRDLGEVLQAADRASNLTRQLLAFGRRQMLRHEVVDLNAVVVEARPLLERLLGENVELELRLDPGLGAVSADAGQLAQVLVNLAVNARDAMPEGGLLTIATADERIEGDEGDAPAGDYVVVTVTDTGAGIDAAVREHLFEPFFTTKEIGKGTGLGLAVVHGIVEQSRGRIAVRSGAGGGAEFRILLPRTDERPNGTVPVALELPRGSETVLLVEDEEMVRRLTVEMLERQGYRVVSAGSPAEALTVEEPYELLLTDVVMPGMSGPELAERLAERRPDAAVLFTSGYSAAAVEDRTTLAARLLEKPFTLEQLAHSVRTALDRR